MITKVDEKLCKSLQFIYAFLLYSTLKNHKVNIISVARYCFSVDIINFFTSNSSLHYRNLSIGYWLFIFFPHPSRERSYKECVYS